MPLPKILLVDDVQLFVELEKSFLNLVPTDIRTAANGKDALDLVRQERPDLIFMDLYMPVMDGASCCAALKADPEFADIPVVMVTTGGKPEEIEQCRTAGCDGLLTKPVEKSAFREMYNRFIPSPAGN
jgi:CheY-like chemotaxis protein